MRWTLLFLLIYFNSSLADIEDGFVVYQNNCLVCHMYDRRGVSGMAPTLINSAWIIGSEELLVSYLMTGGFGPQVLMARFDYLNNQEFLDLVQYLRSEETIESTISIDQIEEIRARYSEENFYD